jgi:nuclear GTP-binding protein
VPEFDSTTMEFLQHLARRFGKMKKVGIPNIEDAAKIVLRGW